MPRKKTKLDIAAAKAAEIIQAHLETLPTAEAKAARREIHALAVRPSRSANREKASRSRKCGILVLYPAFPQNLHKLAFVIVPENPFEITLQGVGFCSRMFVLVG